MLTLYKFFYLLSRYPLATPIVFLVLCATLPFNETAALLSVVVVTLLCLFAEPLRKWAGVQVLAQARPIAVLHNITLIGLRHTRSGPQLLVAAPEKIGPFRWLDFERDLHNRFNFKLGVQQHVHRSPF